MYSKLLYAGCVSLPLPSVHGFFGTVVVPWRVQVSLSLKHLCSQLILLLFCLSFLHNAGLGDGSGLFRCRVQPTEMVQLCISLKFQPNARNVMKCLSANKEPLDSARCTSSHLWKSICIAEEIPQWSLKQYSLWERDYSSKKAWK